MKKLSVIALALVAATLLLAGCGGDSTKATAKVESAPAEATKVAQVKCSGINSCKGTGACASATHSCAGKNSCIGQGWFKASKADCDAKGGTVVSG